VLPTTFIDIASQNPLSHSCRRPAVLARWCDRFWLGPCPHPAVHLDGNLHRVASRL